MTFNHEMPISRKKLIDQIKEHFLSEKERILNKATIASKDFNKSEEKGGKGDEGDVATQEFQQGLELRLMNRELLYLKKIDQSLEKIQSGEFGECASCGEEINSKRLFARPTASFCIVCKEEQEKLEKSTVDGHQSKSHGKLMGRSA